MDSLSMLPVEKLMRYVSSKIPYETIAATIVTKKSFTGYDSIFFNAKVPESEMDYRVYETEGFPL